MSTRGSVVLKESKKTNYASPQLISNANENFTMESDHSDGEDLDKLVLALGLGSGEIASDEFTLW